MRNPLLAILFTTLLIINPASADTVRVATSIKPVHSLVSMVLDGITEPYLIVRGAATPHSHAMRPSDADALANADAVFWIGPALETFLVKPLETLSKSATVVALMEDEETHEGASHEPHAPPEAHGHGHEHDHGGADPHLWLDPEHAKEMVAHIAETMTAILPEQAEKIAANKAQAITTITNIDAEIAGIVAPHRSTQVVVLHDAYGYFTRHYGLKEFTALTVTPEHKPGPGQIRKVRRTIDSANIRCVFAEPQFPDTHIALLIEGSGARSATMDPLGADIEPGATLYPQLMRNLASSLHDCLSGTS